MLLAEVLPEYVLLDGGNINLYNPEKELTGIFVSKSPVSLPIDIYCHEMLMIIEHQNR